ncbi:DMT family transporter [Qipengyuania sp. JC766]|uniref:DMT family transporter n=1 Tax=Qipengyuania sp. JC766 TaxID=3232139 RepID=UPI00345A1EB4
MRHRSPHILPILATLAGVAALSLMDAFMKGASLAIGAYSASLLRSLIGAAIAAPLWVGAGARWPDRAVLKLHLLRGIVSAFMALTFFFALTKLRLAEAIAISFVAPLIALYLAHVLLGETIRRIAIVGSILGFAGTLVIIGGRVGRDTFDADIAMGLFSILVSAMLYAWNFVIIRQQSRVAGPLEVATFHSGVGGAIMLVAAPFFLVLPDWAVLGDIAVASVLTVFGAMAIAWAYARAETQVLVPLEYSGFLWATLFGWLFFAEEVTATTLLGTSLIVLGCWLGTRRGRPLPESS